MGRPKQTVEGTRFIGINDVKELEVDNSYTFTWYGGESISVRKYLDHILLSYDLNGEPMRVYVGLDTTEVGYGVRPWLNCPSCNNRTAKLYNVKGVFACRKCNNLIYKTSLLSGNEFEYITWQIRKLQDELGVSEDNSIPIQGGLVNASIEWLPMHKPKYMRWKTFEEKRGLLEFMIYTRVKMWVQQAKM